MQEECAQTRFLVSVLSTLNLGEVKWCQVIFKAIEDEFLQENNCQPAYNRGEQTGLEFSKDPCELGEEWRERLKRSKKSIPCVWAKFCDLTKHDPKHV